jgi:tetratricopeptide (TPR) repeat protein
VRCQELLEVAPPDLRFRIGWLNTSAQLEARCGNFDLAHRRLSESRALADEIGGQFVVETQTNATVGEVELLAGNVPVAVRALRSATEAFARVEEHGYLASLAQHLANALLANGQDEEALEVTERWAADRLTVPEDADAQILWRHVRAKALARLGQLDEAERLAREGVAMASGTDMVLLHADALASLSEVLGLAGKPEEAEAARLEALGLQEQKGNVVAATELRGRAGAARSGA